MASVDQLAKDSAVPEIGALPPLKVTVAPNGARRTKAQHHELPITIPQIAETARLCHSAGADEIHLHVRDSAGRHTLDPGIYREAIAAISTEAPGMAIQITTESAGRFDVLTQLETLTELRPDAASVSVREILRDPKLARSLYHTATEASTKLQHILYDETDVKNLRRLIEDGTVPELQSDVILVLGSYDPPRLAIPSELPDFVGSFSGEFPNWTVCAFGQSEHDVAEAAIRLGGHIHIGFENNIHRPDGTLATDNTENIVRAVSAARTAGRRLLSEGNKT